MEYPVSHILQGALQGSMIANQIRRTVIENAALQRQQEQDAFNKQVTERELEMRQQQQERQQDAQDLSIQEKLMNIGRPIVGGGVEEIMPFGAGPIPIMRKADPSRILKHKTRGGQTIEVEHYTPEEQRQQMIREMKLKQGVELEGAKQRQMQGYEVDAQARQQYATPVSQELQEALGFNPGTLLPKEQANTLPGMMSYRTHAADSASRAAIAEMMARSRENVAGTQAEARRDVAELGATSRGEVARTRAQATLGAAQTRASGTRGDSGVAGRAEQARIDRLDKENRAAEQKSLAEMDEIDADIEKSHAQRLEIGSTETDAQKREGQIGALAAKIEFLESRKKRIQKREKERAANFQKLTKRSLTKAEAAEITADDLLKKYGVK